MADPAVLGKLVLDAENFVQDLFNQDSDMSSLAIFSRALDRGLPPPQILAAWKDYWTGKFLAGTTPYRVNTGGHAAGEEFETFLYNRAAGRPTDPRSRQIAILKLQKAAAEAEIAAGKLKREDTNLDAIDSMLARLGG